MRKLLCFVLFVYLAITCCKKTIEEKKEDLIISAITNGRWLVQDFKENGTDFTADFSGYEFQFYDNGTVEGIKVTTVHKGSWQSNTSALTITANFSTAGDPIKKLNAVWKITDSYWDKVVATTVIDGLTRNLTLIKK